MGDYKFHHGTKTMMQPGSRWRAVGNSLSVSAGRSGGEIEDLKPATMIPSLFCHDSESLTEIRLIHPEIVYTCIDARKQSSRDCSFYGGVTASISTDHRPNNQGVINEGICCDLRLTFARKFANNIRRNEHSPKGVCH